MLLCYIDESGNPELTGNTSHYVLVGLAIPVEEWKDCEKQVGRIKVKYNLADAELHTAWMLRRYPEQETIKDFETLPYSHRRSQIESYRRSELLKLQASSNSRKYHQVKKNYKHTNDYVHLTMTERRAFLIEIAKLISSWKNSRLFAECIDKIHFDPSRTVQTVEEQAFEQVVSRFEQYLQILNKNRDQNHGLLIHDNNETVAKKHTLLMRKFHDKGTLWTHLEHIIETPLFVNSELTSMIQIADLCSYSLRRYLENGEEELFNWIFKVADQKKGRVVGVRHFTNNNCKCAICESRKKKEEHKTLLRKILPKKE